MGVKKRKILVLGYFGYETNQLDGQTIKTRNIYNLLKSKESEEDYVVEYFDTQSFQKSKLNVFSMLLELVKCNKLLYLPAHNNLTYIFPVVYYLSILFRFKIHYFVVGGWLADFIKNKKFHQNKLSKLSGIYPETEYLSNRLQNEYGFQNVTQLNNFRISDAESSPRKIIEGDEVKLVFMARVHPMKGVDLLFKLSETLSIENLNCNIDIYGPIYEPYDSEFTQKLAKAHPNIKYKGVLQPEKIHETLRDHDLMLFPTKYFTEGFPGTILDAYIAGLPVVATAWKYASEFVEDNVSGLISEFDNDEMFIEKVVALGQDENRLNQLKQNIPKQVEKYSPEAAWEVIRERVVC